MCMQKRELRAIVLAAGDGVRMAGFLPKGLSPVAGKPMLARILKTLKSLPFKEVRLVIRPEDVHLVTPLANSFKAKIYIQNKPEEDSENVSSPQGPPTSSQDQKKTSGRLSSPHKGRRKGTAVSAQCASEDLKSGDLLILNGDHPLINSKDLLAMIEKFYKESLDLCLAVVEKKDPGDYGRIIRQNGQIKAIVEKADLKQEEASVKEVNAGFYLLSSQCLNQYLPQIKNHNLKKEYYLTDLVSLLYRQGKKTGAVEVCKDTALGVNTQKDLASLTKRIFTHKLYQLMAQGVIIVDPLNTYIEEDVTVGYGSMIYPGVYLKGKTCVGHFSAIESHSFISDSVVGDMVLIRAGSYMESAVVKAQAQVGPYARLRPGTQIGQQAKVGNFVEMKGTEFGAKSKAGHFSYLGDCKVGEEVNIGCGVVSVNLNPDGSKHVTEIGDKAFVGSGTQLVAPVKLGEGALTGAGSVIVKDVPEDHLALSRVEQINKPRKRK